LQEETPLPATAPNAAITKIHNGNFVVGQQGSYTFSVQNVGDAATSGSITVTDTLPNGLTLVSASGTDWDCSGSSIGGHTIICIYSLVLAPNASAPDITVTVNVGAGAAPGVINTAFVTTPGDLDPSNDQSTDETPIPVPPIPTLSQWGMIVEISALLAAVFWRLRRRLASQR